MSINTATGEVTLQTSESILEEQREHARILQEHEAINRANQIVIPTQDIDVKMYLRVIGEPICLFGENPANRRNRLRLILAKSDMTDDQIKELAGQMPTFASAVVGGSTDVKDKVDVATETFYTRPKDQSLELSRKFIFDYSMKQANQRLLTERGLNEEERAKIDVECSKLYANLNSVALETTQVGGERPLTRSRFSPDETEVLTAGWCGKIKLWDLKTTDLIREYIGHDCRVHDIAFRPTNTEGTGHFASAGADSVAYIWNTETETPIASLKGHAARLCQLAWHPSGRFIATTSFDHTWRLWDVEAQKELLLQEGHIREVYPIAFQCDGALVATGDLEGVGRVWDLRSGKSIFTMKHHIKKITSIDWSPNGYQLATGSDDNFAKIVDLRKQSNIYSICAHSGLVSRVQFAPKSGEFLATSSFDRTCKLWSARDFTQLTTFRGEQEKVMDIDISKSETSFLTCSFDHSWKIWNGCKQEDWLLAYK
eukprot:TRINITY_DN778229_c0_g1_i1.p1 TRINITY_DN778229_c0_g1~~TRINITY_DN778229_c0_g1_i1.p1  ORF type:complete len:485 (+),score=120.58 TRINITY_DN778229_c0_g1_i1:98-1552(+)